MAPSIESQSQSIPHSESKPLHSCEPSLEKDSGFHPLLKAIMRGGMRTQLGLGKTPAKGLPFAAHKRWHQHKLDRILVGVPRQNDAC